MIFRELNSHENQRLFCDLFGAFFTRILNLLLLLAFFDIKSSFF